MSTMCRVLSVSASGYYAWGKREPSQRQREDEHLTEQIRQAFQKGRQVYGSPRVHAELRAQGIHCGRHRVARLMREAGLQAIYKCRRRMTTTDSRHSDPVAPNLLAREFTAPAPDKKWLTDITAIWTAQGWLYLAVVLDVYSRLIVGWAMSPHREESLVETVRLHGTGQTTTQPGVAAPLRPRQPIHQPGLPERACPISYSGEYEQEGRLLR